MVETLPRHQGLKQKLDRNYGKLDFSAWPLPRPLPPTLAAQIDVSEAS
jgi:hypothetical protein